MWTLIFFVSTGWGNAALGGPATLDNFTSASQCRAAGEQIKTVLESKLDWYKCVEIKK